ncbi:16S rRNA (guanine(527)-N(7))-methyltransferase RsmG [Altererythrobacter confluentis]|uniref:Ribosomal RNA small subunit methyltransferase G n=2 Tax=Allopontixanthobacter confluentis TaxID=1849021 RepID=A0A6L7GI34_9SPHN|nr:16S rRNA (guanine(527)-N(7))-methyltransferase RsmG [Allopontixanthobacter confluentis]
MIADEATARSYVASLCDDTAMQKLDQFVDALIAESEQQNLIASATIPILWQRHIADSAQLLEYVPRGTGLWLDLGTGAGLPGLVVAIMRPEMRVDLVESRKRRIEWLERMRDELELDNCEVIGSRLENVETVPAAIISARAFAPLDRMMAVAERFSTRDTLWLLPKGRSAAQELELLSVKDRKMFHVEQSRTDDDSGIIVGKLARK